MTTTVGNTMLVTAHTYASATTWTPPTGMTEALDAMAGGQSLEASYVLQPAAAATGAKTASANGAPGDEDQGNTHILALKPTDPPLTLNKPAAVLANDVMIAAIGFRPATATLTVPEGWTLVRRIDNTVPGASNSLAVYRKVAGSSEPTSYVWNLAGDTYTVGGIQAFYNVDTANPIDVENGQTTPYGLSHATPSVATTVANAMIVTAHTFETATTWTPPAGMIEGFDVKFGGQSIEGNYVLQPTAGATGTKTATAAGTSGDQDEGVTHILALRPAALELKLHFVHVDHLNQPRLITNQAQQVVWRHDQAEPFGNNPPDENPSGLGAFEFPLRDEGTYADKETNLVYNWNRYRDPDGGRFIQADPLGLRGGDLSLYVLRKNSPLSFTDPMGLAVWFCTRHMRDSNIPVANHGYFFDDKTNRCCGDPGYFAKNPLASCKEGGPFSNGVLGPSDNVLEPNQTANLDTVGLLPFLPETQRPIQLEIHWSASDHVLVLDVALVRIGRERNAVTGMQGQERSRHLRDCRTISLKK